MNISRESLEIILDLIEIKVNTLQIHDKDDARELNRLRKCRQELLSHLKQLSLNPLKMNKTEDPSLKKSDYQPTEFTY